MSYTLNPALVVKVLMEDAEKINKMSKVDDRQLTVANCFKKALADIGVFDTRIAASGDYLHITCTHDEYQKMWSNLSLPKDDESETFRIEDNLTYGHEVVILGYHSNSQQSNSVSQSTRELFAAKGRHCSSMSSRRDGGGNWTTIAHCKDEQQKTEFLRPGCFVVMGTQAVEDNVMNAIIKRFLKCEVDGMTMAKMGRIKDWIQDMETNNKPFPEGLEEACRTFKLSAPKSRQTTTASSRNNQGTAGFKKRTGTAPGKQMDAEPLKTNQETNVTAGRIVKSKTLSDKIEEEVNRRVAVVEEDVYRRIADARIEETIKEMIGPELEKIETRVSNAFANWVKGMQVPMTGTGELARNADTEVMHNIGRA
ncbi:hypothetical protein BDR26DRAFT_893406 [Obelidium mucronatum]|nr:hypothetical protein BDR26DRAFT_893406 [Obelidium mucronatum]